MTDQIPQPKHARHLWQWAIFALLVLVVWIVPLPVRAAEPTQRTFRIDARQFEYNPAILKVNPGDQVTIELVATDVVHGFKLDGYDLETTADPGKTSRLTFIADKQGTYRFHCTVTCGNMHPFMTGKLEVGQNTLLWRAGALIGLAFIVAVWMGRK